VDCEHARELIDRRLDEALSEAEACELERHLAACRGCSSVAQECQRLARDLAALPPPEIRQATWDERVGRAVAEGAARLRDRRDRRAIRRLAWATAAVWLAAWLLGGQVTPRVWRQRRVEPAPAAQVQAADAEAGGPYEGSLAQLSAAVRVRPMHDAPAVIPRGIVIERLLASEDSPDESDADQPPIAPGPKSLDEGVGAEESSHV
jgi:hypothetical protein